MHIAKTEPCCISDPVSLKCVFLFPSPSLSHEEENSFYNMCLLFGFVYEDSFPKTVDMRMRHYMGYYMCLLGVGVDACNIFQLVNVSVL